MEIPHRYQQKLMGLGKRTSFVKYDYLGYLAPTFQGEGVGLSPSIDTSKKGWFEEQHGSGYNVIKLLAEILLYFLRLVGIGKWNNPKNLPYWLKNRMQWWLNLPVKNHVCQTGSSQVPSKELRPKASPSKGTFEDDFPFSSSGTC